ncbi:DUF3817 domain-containing protein [Nocardioides sambongensis]|uniref:DUF3817 domain-containing protein n=1 Tax=Nocardioides sambongensis TaxID=2589074 RepID=UPI00112A0E42|nr:DUF3817 domain-containing protein [Nocardioides sambongensis]
MNPEKLFRRVAVAEAITWALLLIGMFLKYGTETTELGVRVFGIVHGAVFVAYVVVTALVAVDRRWGVGRTLVALVAAIPPFATLLLEWWAVRHRWLAPTWRLRAEAPSGPLDWIAAWVLRKPARGAAVGVCAVAVLTGAALLVGPPTS